MTLAKWAQQEVPMRFFFVASLLATAAGCATVSDTKPAASSSDPAFTRRATTWVVPPQPKPADDPTRPPTPPEGTARLDNSR